ncbi:phosphatase PAP2 family protein [Amycolatopsis sp. PS_44_ISF1]|uniref:phosphatase PAP2 family protein n=1 Tax=Amycolatopsis sp. PS_44_ISF1 TaxID=2974917 RepID=UPI0028DE80C3|nr:phosphatase PAP2 family protein [Amycolatopsis sp. PS_44_ISF1]MDT8914418.1 phosphatase PAP2 family protein [Amycolatopsis sp. PS_44_ISF1]
MVLLTAFLLLGLAVAHQPLALDQAVADALRGQYSRPAGQVAGVVTTVLGPVLPFALGLALVVLVLRERARLPLGLKLAAVLILGRLTSVVFKPVFLRPRPRAYPDLSYPSGHVVSVASTALVAVLLVGWLAPKFVARTAVIGALATVLAAVCRIVLGVHWVTDTVGAVLAVLGVGLVSASALRLLPLPARDRRSLDE